MLNPKISKSCDECKSRKVRCERASNSETLSCNNCKKYGRVCYFRPRKTRAKRVTLDSHLDGQSNFVRSSTPSGNLEGVPNSPLHGNATAAEAIHPSPMSVEPQLQAKDSEQLYIDRLLDDDKTAERRRAESSVIKAHDQYVGSSGIAFFSDRKIASLSNRLGHRKLWDLFETITNSINSRMNCNDSSPAVPVKFNAASTSLQISESSAKLYITAYFERVHPIYPFIDRDWFEKRAFGEHLSRLLQDSPSFSALYYTVLALGSQLQGGGSFEPGKGIAWEFYRVPLDLLSEVLIRKDALVKVQAITAMAIFAQSSSCIQIGHMLTAEAARMAQSLGLHRAIYDGGNVSACRRTFWVIYFLEKTLSFTCGRTSVLIDSDIGTPIPDTPCAVLTGFDWLRAICRFGRMVSKAYDSLFSISATLASRNSIRPAINKFKDELEAWRQSIPEKIRPGYPLRALNTSDSTSMVITLRLHYHYFGAILALVRISSSLPEAELPCPSAEMKDILLKACSAVIELTNYIDTASYTPVWILLSVPLSALFALFDFIIYNPTHERTKSNLALLGIATGYFCRLEYSSDGALQTSILSDIAHIARDYIHNDVDGGIGVSGASKQQSAAGTESQTPVSLSEGPNIVEDVLQGLTSAENFIYSTAGDQFPISNRFSEGFDLGQLFYQFPPSGYPSL